MYKYTNTCIQLKCKLLASECPVLEFESKDHSWCDLELMCAHMCYIARSIQPNGNRGWFELAKGNIEMVTHIHVECAVYAGPM